MTGHALIDPVQAGPIFTEAIACTLRSGDHLVADFLLTNAGVHALRAGDIPAARTYLQQAAQAIRAIGGENLHLAINIGWVLRQDNDPDGARSSFEAALRMSRRSGDRADVAYASLGLGCLAGDKGDRHQAARLALGPVPWPTSASAGGGCLDIARTAIPCPARYAARALLTCRRQRQRGPVLAHERVLTDAEQPGRRRRRDLDACSPRYASPRKLAIDYLKCSTKVGQGPSWVSSPAMSGLQDRQVKKFAPGWRLRHHDWPGRMRFPCEPHLRTGGRSRHARPDRPVRPAQPRAGPGEAASFAIPDQELAHLLRRIRVGEPA